ncbi:MAG: Lrp/AsnC family transcriptional regulator [Hyphomicrobiales bacterium]
MNEITNLQALDIKILDALKEDCRLSNQEVAEQVGSSPSSVWRRIKTMEEAGVISGFRLELKPEKLGFMETILVQVSLNHHTDENLQNFTDLMSNTAEVLECYATTGEHDFMIKVLAIDVRSYHRFLRNTILSKSYVEKAQSIVVMEKLKDRKVVPSALVQAS